ncbi:hypothetical protein PROFUN_08859 [Planoprotostelium fungivorum]|uniref:Protein kinase domain-containing protein n=1 Tax=Planoprotostelium fungivorum TaxID=1890364 RepID=A0A2P6NJ03_9EUKA|nr:hypothetical protein PROFUN_08859 [Planoprotostelium fungivorum]
MRLCYPSSKDLVIAPQRRDSPSTEDRAQTLIIQHDGSHTAPIHTVSTFVEPNDHEGQTKSISCELSSKGGMPTLQMSQVTSQPSRSDNDVTEIFSHTSRGDRFITIEAKLQTKILAPEIFRQFIVPGTEYKEIEAPMSDRLTPNVVRDEEPDRSSVSAGANMQPNMFPKEKTHKRRVFRASSLSPLNATRLQHLTKRSSITVVNDIKQQQGPFTPSEFIKLHLDLSPMEEREVNFYKELYYRGEPRNNEQSDYIVHMKGQIQYRYEIVGILGKGSFGQVVRVMDHKDNRFYALKIVRSKMKYYQQALSEDKILKLIQQKDPSNQSHLVQMVDSFEFRGHFCILFELLSINLYEFLQASQFKGFTIRLIRKFATQILVSLKFMQKNRLIHCDLKPENILLREPTKSAVTIIDFGSSCFDHERSYTYIQSRFYRAPEVILGMPYTGAIDVWSMGCILAELYTGTALFMGENELDQLLCIMEVLGLPPENMMQQSIRKGYFFTPSGKPRMTENSKGLKRTPEVKDLKKVLRCDDDLFVSFLSECFRYDPKERLTPNQALSHPWIKMGKMDIPIVPSAEDTSADDRPLGNFMKPLKPRNMETADVEDVISMQPTVLPAVRPTVQRSMSRGEVVPLPKRSSQFGSLKLGKGGSLRGGGKLLPELSRKVAAIMEE